MWIYCRHELHKKILAYFLVFYTPGETLDLEDVCVKCKYVFLLAVAHIISLQTLCHLCREIYIYFFIFRNPSVPESGT